MFDLVWADHRRKDGALWFYGTQVPVMTLFHVISGGGNIEEFLHGVGGVAREQAVGVLNFVVRGLMGGLIACAVFKPVA